MSQERGIQEAIELCQKGESYSQKSSYSVALQYFEKAEPTLKSHQNYEWLAFLYHQKFYCYLFLKKIGEAKTSFQEALANYKITKNEEGIFSILISCLDFWKQEGDFERVFFYLKISEAIAENQHRSSSGFLFQKIAQVYNQKKFFAKSIQYYTKAIEIFKNQERNKAECFYEKGLVFKSIFQFPEALDCLQGAVKIFSDSKNNSYLIKSLEQTRKILLSQGKANQAREIANKIVRLGQISI